MPELADIELLRQYAQWNSEAAFAALVGRHLNMVYSAALRKTGNPQAAEEIAQAVFVILARKASRLGSRTILSGWLYQTTRLTSASYLRTEMRRVRREQKAYMQTFSNEAESEIWLQVAPLLEDAMGKLSEKERNAIALRFFEGKSFQQIGAAVGASENAAKKRVVHALEKLRRLFAKRGVVSTASLIAGTLSTHATITAPVPSIQSVTAIAIAKGATASTTTLTLIKGALKIMAWTKAKTAIVCTAVVGLAAFSVMQHQAQAKLRRQNRSLQQQLDQLSQLEEQNQNLSNQLARANSSEVSARRQLNTLLQQRAREQQSNAVQAATPPPKQLAPPPQSVSTPTATANIELPKDTWADVGFTSPQAALRTRGWAILNGDRDAFRQSVYIIDDARKFAEDSLVQMAKASTDPNKAQDIQKIVDDNWGVEEAILMPMMAANRDNTLTGYKILSQQSPSVDEMVMQVETDTASTPPATQTFNFKRFGNDWKVVINKETIQNMMSQ